MRRLLERPFLVLAFFTLIVGAMWHLSGFDYDQGPLGFALFAFSYVLGAPFIVAMRLVGSVVSHPALRGVLGFALGMLPYLAADELLRRRRLRKRG
ncbi:MAG: hypothetical protein M3125_02190 [Gemmatimonadota bacterium]|nr:hypothetical protein [Gemmatimonadota bacterium]